MTSFAFAPLLALLVLLPEALVDNTEEEEKDFLNFFEEGDVGEGVWCSMCVSWGLGVVSVDI